MANSSATGGYLVPVAANEDKALRDFFQAAIKSITGIAGELVRPRWQPNPPKQPDVSVNWCSFGFNSVKSDGNAYVKTALNGNSSTLVRHETFDLLATFYGANCYGYASLLRDGLEITQNRDVLTQNGISFLASGDIVHNPELINDIWFDRQDLTLRFSREMSRVYDILSFVDASGTVITDNEPPLIRDFNAQASI